MSDFQEKFRAYLLRNNTVSLRNVRYAAEDISAIAQALGWGKSETAMGVAIDFMTSLEAQAKEQPFYHARSDDQKDFSPIDSLVKKGAIRKGSDLLIEAAAKAAEAERTKKK